MESKLINLIGHYDRFFCISDQKSFDVIIDIILCTKKVKVKKNGRILSCSEMLIPIRLGVDCEWKENCHPYFCLNEISLVDSKFSELTKSQVLQLVGDGDCRLSHEH